MIARGCGVKLVTAVTGEARRPSPKSPWSGGEKEVSYVGALVEVVPIGMNRFFYLLSENYSPQLAYNSPQRAYTNPGLD